MRIELGGVGFSIPDLALPDPDTSNLPTQVLELENGIPFEKAVWEAFGYTHYEVWVVGGSGGRGGDGATKIEWVKRRDPSVNVTLTWEQFQTFVIYNVIPGYYYVRGDPPGYPNAPVYGSYLGNNSWMMTQSDLEAYYNPARLYNPTLMHHPEALGIPICGGGGGGGGLHVVSGALADLPDSVPVVVGSAGEDAAIGQLVVNGAYLPKPGDATNIDGSVRLYPPNAVYPVDADPFYPPGYGEDGEASSFNGSMCQASGGKGGGPAGVWSGSKINIAGVGGDGGLGGRSTAGGGGAGSNSSKFGSDGSWNGVIGGGGGGGRGGAYIEPTVVYGSFDPSGYGASEMLGADTLLGPTVAVTLDPDVVHNINFPYVAGNRGYYSIQGTGGGRGSFSYLDTTIFGDRHQPAGIDVHRLYYDPITGVNVPSKDLIGVGKGKTKAGTGGGVKAIRKLKYGSDATGYSQDGAVILRLIKND